MAAICCGLCARPGHSPLDRGQRPGPASALLSILIRCPATIDYTQHTLGSGALLRGHILAHKQMTKGFVHTSQHPIGVDIHLYIYTSTLTLTAARGDGELFYKVEMDPSVGCVGSADGLTRQKLATRCRVWHSNINN